MSTANTCNMQATEHYGSKFPLFLVSPNKPQPQRHPAGMAGSTLPAQRQDRKRKGSNNSSSERKRKQGQQQQRQQHGEQQLEQQQQQRSGRRKAAAAQQQRRSGPAHGREVQVKKHEGAASLLFAPGQRASMPMRKIISARCLGFKGGLHPQHNRPVRDLVKYHASLTMEEVADGVRGLFAHLFWPVRSGNMVAEVLADPLVAEGYGCLRRFGHFHLTEGSWDTWPEFEQAVDAAQAQILRYGALAEQVSMGQ